MFHRRIFIFSSHCVHTKYVAAKSSCPPTPRLPLISIQTLYFHTFNRLHINCFFSSLRFLFLSFLLLFLHSMSTSVYTLCFNFDVFTRLMYFRCCERFFTSLHIDNDIRYLYRRGKSFMAFEAIIVYKTKVK